MHKKTSLTELFYLTLLITALRPPDHQLIGNRHRHRERIWRANSSDTLGSILIEDICLNSRNHGSNGWLPNFKQNSPLLAETNQVLDYINSLGRYGDPLPFSSNLFAYPMSNGHSEYAADLAPLIAEDIPQLDGSQSPIFNLSNLYEEDILSEFDSLQLSPYNETNFDIGDLNEVSFDENGLLFDNEVETIFFDEELDRTTVTASNVGSINESNTNFTNANEIEDANRFLSSTLDVDQLLTDGSVMFPTMNDSNDGDVNDLFGELELLLANETDSYGQEWAPSTHQTTNFYSATDETGIPSNGDYPLYPDSVVHHGPCSTIYDTTSTNTNPINSFPNSNFSAVLYSSLTTLSNGNEHLSSAATASVPPTTTTSVDPHHQQQSIYNSSDISDIAYMSNVSSSDCYYNGYLSDEIADPNHHQLGTYGPYNGQPQQQQQQQQPQPQPPSGTFTANSVQAPNSNQFQTPTNTASTTNGEDCFDKSSDSAVSSMSSDRVQSFSDNEWAETSSESSYNGEVVLSDYSAHNNPENDKSGHKSSAQKKYRLYGKNGNKNGELVKTQPIVNGTTGQNGQEYFYDYNGHSGFTVGYPVDPNYEQMNYYQTIVGHNHTYAQPQPTTPTIEVVTPQLDSTIISTENWNHEPLENNIVKKESEQPVRSSTKSSTPKKQTQHHQQTNEEFAEMMRKDPHLNRDEKRARALKIPISTQDIINLPIDEFNERLTKYELTEIQLSLIRDIRRRGKNKVAAQNCRKRKLDQIMGLQSEVDNMFNHKNSLEAQYNQLLMLRELARDKYTKLYQFVIESSSSRQSFFDVRGSPPDFPDRDASNSTIEMQPINHDSLMGQSFVMLSSNITASTSTAIAVDGPGVHQTSFGHHSSNEFVKPE